MRRKHLVVGAAGICAFAAVSVFLFHFFPARDPGSLPARGAAVNPFSNAVPGRLVTTAARTLAVPLAFNAPPRQASASGEGKRATQADAAHERFARWAEVYFSASTSSEKAALSAQGKELAAARREALAALIQIYPKHALELAAPWKWREVLPSEIASLLEERVSGRGNFSVFGAVPLEGQDEFVGPILRYATLDSVAYRAFVYGRRQYQVSQQGIALHGIAINDVLAVHEDPVRVLEPEEAQAVLAKSPPAQDPICSVSGLPANVTGKPTVVAYGNQILQLCHLSHVSELNKRLLLAEGGSYGLRGRGVTNAPPVNPWTYGPKRALFMRVNFPDDPTEPITEAAATELMNQVNEFYVESSFNKTTFIPTITPLLTLPQPKLYYTLNGPGALMSDARQVARDAGYPQNYDRDIVRFVTVPGFNFGGLGAVGASGVWLQSSALGVACHELGHNSGLFHANLWNTRIFLTPWAAAADATGISTRCPNIC